MIGTPRKHGTQGRRQWRKVHLAKDPATSDIRAVEFTPGRDGDSPVLPDLLGQTPEVCRLAPLRLTVPTMRAAAARPSSSATQIRQVCRNVKCWRDAQMALRCTAAGMIEAAKGFLRLRACRQLPILKAALEKHRSASEATVDPASEAAYP